MKNLFVFVCFALALGFALDAVAQMEGPNNWMASKAYDIYISGYVQGRWTYTDGGDPDNAFSLPRARVEFAGSLNENWGFVLETELAGDVSLRTTGVAYKFTDGQVFLGQGKSRLVLENITSSSELDTINRSGIAGAVNEYDIGLFLNYGFLEGKVGVEASVTNGPGLNAAEVNDAKDYTIRVWGKPFQGSENMADGLLIAGAFSMGDQQETDVDGIDLGDFDRTIWVGTAQWIYSGIKVQGEYANVDQDLAGGGSMSTDGWYVLASYDLPMEGMTVTPVAKYETIDGSVADGDWITLGVRVSFIGTHDVKIEANYILEDLDIGESLDEFILQLQAKF